MRSLPFIGAHRRGKAHSDDDVPAVLTTTEHGEVGFDQSAGCLAGIMNLEGDENGPSLPAIKVVNDYITAWLLSTGIVEALTRRALNGGSYRVHVSLTRAALWLISLGILEKAYATAVAGTDGAHTYLDPEVFIAGIFRFSATRP